MKFRIRTVGGKVAERSVKLERGQQLTFLAEVSWIGPDEDGVKEALWDRYNELM